MTDLKELNQILLEELDNREQKIQQLEGDLEELLQDSNQGSNQQLLTLAKKNKSLIVKVNKLQGQIATLEKKYQKTKTNQQAKHFTTKKSTSVKETVEEHSDEIDNLLKQYKKKNEKNVLRIATYRDENQKLKLELKKLRNIIKKEVGDEEVDSRSDGWRGRQQEILLLKSKVKQLQLQLSENPKKIEPTKNIKVQSTIKKIEETKKKDLKTLQDEVDKKEKRIKILKQKLDGSKARNEILEKQQSSSTMKFNRLLSKTQNDSKYIALLKQELDKLKSKLSKTQGVLNDTRTIKPGETLESTLATLHNQEISGLGQQLDDAYKVIAEKDDKIDSLKRQLQEAVVKNSSNPKLMQQISGSSSEMAMRCTMLQLEVEKYEELKQLMQQKSSDDELKISTVQESLRNAQGEIQKLKRQIEKHERQSTTVTYKQDDDEGDDLADQLFFSMDEINTLKATLKSLRQSKQKEIRIWQELALESKKKVEEFFKENKLVSKREANLPTDVSECQEKIESLESQLKEYKNRYTSVQLQLQRLKGGGKGEGTMSPKRTMSFSQTKQTNAQTKPESSPRESSRSTLSSQITSQSLTDEVLQSIQSSVPIPEFNYDPSSSDEDEQ